MKTESGYSGTPLAKKLGIKSSFRIKTKNAPTDYEGLLAQLPERVVISTRLKSAVDLWHLFTKSKNELTQQLAIAVTEIHKDGMV